jgi:peptidoglycan/LPS O-acetylase OafA/YrhL
MNKGITSFRALAFFAVFLFHIHWLQAGYLGVQAFFVLSGFLLIPILIQMKAALSTKDFFVHFYGRRALRIFPLYYAYIIAVAGVSFLLDDQKAFENIPQIDRYLEQLPWALTYTYDFFHATDFYQHTPLVTHFWSLAVEEQFYLIFPFVVFLIPPNRLKAFLLSMIILGPLIRLVLFLIITKNIMPVLDERVDLVVYVLPFSHLSAFAVGGFAALYLKRQSTMSALAATFTTLVVGMVTDFAFTRSFSISDLGFAPFMRDSYKFIWGYFVLNLIFGILLIQIRDRRLFPALLENPLLHYLGKISYGLYVFHFPMIWVVNSTLSEFSMAARALVALVITIVMSAMSYELMEKHFIGLKDKFFAHGISA